MTKRKKTMIIVWIFIVILLAAGFCVWHFLPQPLSYHISEIEPIASRIHVVSRDAGAVTIQKEFDGYLKILMFTDMHLDGNNATSSFTVDRMVKSIQSEEPDLVLLGGDNVTSGFNKKRSHQLAQIFEKLGVYWGGVIGNHEGDNKFSISREKMVDIFMSYDHCIMRKGPEDIDGNCNYVINILNNDSTLSKAIYCLDTFDEIDDEIRESHTIFEGKHYDGAHENQVKWYRDAAAGVINAYGENDSMMLLHIPLPAYDKAVAANSLLYGEQNEGICSTAYENGLYDAIVDMDTTKVVFCGHDHVNNFGVEYNGILFSYIESSGYGSYGMKKKGAPESEWLQGYTKLEIKNDGNWVQTQYKYFDLYGSIEE